MYCVNTIHGGFCRKIYTTYTIRRMHLFFIFKTLNRKRLIFLANILADEKFINWELQLIVCEIRFCRRYKVIYSKSQNAYRRVPYTHAIHTLKK